MPKRKTTRNAQGAGTIRQRKDGRWEARYTVGRDPGTGKQIQRSVYGDTQQEVRQKLTAASKELDDGTYSAPSKMTVGQWLDIWSEEYLGAVKPFTVASYKTQISNHIKPALGAVKLDTLNTHSIQKFYNALGKPKGDKAALSPKTIKNVHGVLHKALEQAVAVGYLRYNPSDACTLPRVAKKDIKPLDDDEINLFLGAIKGHQFEAVYFVDLFTGLRQGEILGLKWDCVKIELKIFSRKKQGSSYNALLAFSYFYENEKPTYKSL